MKEYYRVKACIHLDAIYKNIYNMKKLLNNDTEVMAVIKADGYGHGAVLVAKVLDSLCYSYGVATVQEGVQLRKAGINKPILVLGYTHIQNYEEIVFHEIDQTIFEYNSAKELSNEAARQGKKVKIHIKLDTGMNRIGFACTYDSIEEIKKIASLENVVLEGIFTHFASADEYDRIKTNKQIEVFKEFIYKLEQNNINIPIKHISNSAGILQYREAQFNMVRSGISTYGLHPSDTMDNSSLDLFPAMELRSKVVYVKEVEEGACISYGGTYVANEKMKIATIPVGYADGYPRNLSSKGRVLINGTSAPIVGRICMDQFLVDVTHIENIKIDDDVTLIGIDGKEHISVEEIANTCNGFHYEIICGISKRVPREYYMDEKKVGTMDFDDSAKITLIGNLENKALYGIH